MLNKEIKEMKENGFSEEEFLLSDVFKNYLLRQAQIISGNYSLDIKFSNNTCTDGNIIEINPLHDMYKNLNLEEKVLCILGSLVHELFHILYTDFNIFLNSLEEFKSNHTLKELYIYKQIINILEDSYIELKGINYYTGTFRTAILFNNKICFCNFENIEKYNKKKSELNTLLMMCASYCILGNIKGTINNEKINNIFLKIKPLLNQGRIEDNSLVRIEYCKKIYSYIEELIPKKEEKESNKGNENKESKNVENHDNARDSNGEENGNCKFQYPKNENKFNNCQSLQINIRNNNPNTNTNTNTIIKSEDLKEIIDEEIKKSLKSIQNPINQYKKELDDNKKENQLKKQIVQLENINLKGIHKNIKLNTIKISKENCYQDYFILYKKIAFIKNVLVKKLKSLLSNDTSYRLEGYYSGRLSRKRLYRQDNKIFTKLLNEKNISDLAITILVDQSGSMSNNRIKYAKLACILFTEVCQELNIPISVIGHTALNRKDIVQHRHFIDFDSIKSQKYSLTKMKAYENTREGLSLLYAKEYIEKRQEKDKIIISITDGESVHCGKNSIYYADNITIKDIQEQIKLISTNNIKVIGLAIGEDKTIIKDLYKPNYIDINNLELLPIKLINILKQNILK